MPFYILLLIISIFCIPFKDSFVKPVEDQVRSKQISNTDEHNVRFQITSWCLKQN